LWDIYSSRTCWDKEEKEQKHIWGAVSHSTQQRLVSDMNFLLMLLQSYITIGKLFSYGRGMN
jgi:hypothetical protein